MSVKPRPLVAGNWKMNGLKASLAEISAMVAAYDSTLKQKADLLICPPATLISQSKAAGGGSGLEIGLQGYY